MIEPGQWNMDRMAHTALAVLIKTLQHRVTHTVSPLAGQRGKTPRKQRRAEPVDQRCLLYESSLETRCLERSIYKELMF